jgi:hypothetical protein
MKKVAWMLGVLAVVGVGYYLISPLFITTEVNDPVPEGLVSGDLVDSGAESLTEEEAANFEEAMRLTNSEPAEPMTEEAPLAMMVRSDVVPSFPVMGTRGHPASGTVRVIESDTETIIRYEDFETINGPQLRVYLANDLDATDYVDLGPVRGTKGNINYTVPAGVDVSEYRYVMYWCEPFSVLFNYADLSQ